MSVVDVVSGLETINQRTGERSAFELYPIQREILSTVHRFDNVLVLKARQLGISTLICAYIATFAALYPDRSIAICADTAEKAKLLLGKVKDFLKQYGQLVDSEGNHLVSLVEDNKFSISTSSGTTITALTASSRFGEDNKTGRAASYHLILLSELGFYPNGQALLAALTSTRLAKTKIIIETTASARSDILANLWTVNNHYQKVFAGLEQHPHYVRDPSELTESEWQNLQKTYHLKDRAHAAFFAYKLKNDFLNDEIKCLREYPVTDAQAFLSSSDRWIRANPPLASILRKTSTTEYYAPDSTEKVLIGVDTSGGLGADASAMVAINHKKTLLAVYYSATDHIKETLNAALEIREHFPNSTFVIESNGVGAATLQEFRRANLPCREVYTTEDSRYAGMLQSRLLLESGEAAVSKTIQEECKHCHYEKNKFKGPKDGLMALGFALTNINLIKPDPLPEPPPDLRKFRLFDQLEERGTWLG